MRIMRLLSPILALVAGIVSGPANAVEPEQREAVVVSGRVWEGFEYREIFVPSTIDEVTLIGGQDSALTYVRTLEYYWPLSRQVYVDFDRQRAIVDGELVVRRDGREVVRSPLHSFVIVYPQGAVNGNGLLLWGGAAEDAYRDYRENEARFIREHTAARLAHSEYERQLLAAGAERSAGAPIETIPPPPKLPEPSLRLVTAPQPGFRIALEAGDYAMALEQGGAVVPGTARRLRVVSRVGTDAPVADIIPEERWTRPLPADSPAARIFVRPGATFYLTLAMATRFAEEDYVPVVSPQNDVVPGRPIWVRRQPAMIHRAQVTWTGKAPETIERLPLKVEQTRGASFGYVVRPASEGETSDLDAFTITAPLDPAVARGSLRSISDMPFVRDVILVHPRNAAVSLALALLPLFGAALAVRRARVGRRIAKIGPL